MDSVNLKTFPELGAYSGEVGSSNSIGGINNMNGQWPMSLPLQYFWQYGIQRRKSHKKRKSKFSSRKRKLRRSRK